MKERVTRAQSQVEWSEGLMDHLDTWGSVAEELSVAVKAAGMEAGLGGYGSGTSA